jgi:hypothetical protein
MPPINRNGKNGHTGNGKSGERNPVADRIAKLGLGEREPVVGEVLGERIVYDQDDGTTTSFEDLAEVIDEVAYLIPGWIPRGMVTGLVAHSKVGKSALALGGFALPILLGGKRPWFDGTPGPGPLKPGFVLWCDTESTGSINLTRVRQWGIPLRNLKNPFPTKDELFIPVDIDNQAHIDRLERVICKYGIQLVILDSWRGAHAGDENSSKAVAGLLALARLCEKTGAACVVIHHTGKEDSDKDPTVDCARGTTAFLAAVRAQIVLDRPDPKSAWRRMQVKGENLGTAPDPIGFQITSTGILFGDAPIRPKKENEKAKELNDGVDWLRKNMKIGVTCDAGDLEALADNCGRTIRTIRRAADELGVRKVAIREGGKIVRWEWTRPAEGGSATPTGRNM